MLKTLDIELTNKNVFFRLCNTHRNLSSTLPKNKENTYVFAEDVLTVEVLNIFPEHLCIINLQGKILFANKAWIDFECSNTDKILTNWLNVNYLDVCDKSAKSGVNWLKKQLKVLKP